MSIRFAAIRSSSRWSTSTTLTGTTLKRGFSAADTLARTPPVRESAYRKPMNEPPEPPTEVHEPAPGDGDGFWTRLKRALWGSRPRRIMSVLLALLVLLVAVGGIADALNGESKPPPTALPPESTSGEPPGSSSPQSTSAEADCTTGPVGHNMRVTFYGASNEACTSLNREVAQKRAEYWRTVPAGNRVEGSQLVCSMAKGGELVEVRDTGEHIYGNSVCAGLTAEGFTETEGPGEKAEREQKAQHEQQEAAAAANAEHEKQQQREAEKPKLEEELPSYTTKPRD